MMIESWFIHLLIKANIFVHGTKQPGQNGASILNTPSD